MKRILIISMLFLCWVSTSAQEDYESFLSESKIWTMMIQPPVNPGYFIETKLVGDTVINGIHFKQKYERQCKQEEEMPAEWTASKEYVGQEGGKIYLYSSITDRMILDMDISLAEGSMIGCYDLSFNSEVLFNFEVTAVSDTLFDCSADKVRRRCVYVNVEGRPLGHPFYTDVWVEGVGSLNYGISGVWRILATGASVRMTKCTDGDAVIYQNDIPLNIESVNVYLPEDNYIYDLQGRLSATPAKGVYIQNGKKRIVR